MAVSYGKGDRGKATRLHSLIVRSRGVCERCGEGDYSRLVCAHIVRRGPAWTRTDEKNAWCLCGSCHYRVDNYADEFMAFVERTIGLPEYLRLKHKALTGVGKKFDWKAEAARLSEVWKQIQEQAA